MAVGRIRSGEWQIAQDQIDPRKQWWADAAENLGREVRDRLIQCCSQFGGDIWVLFKNGKSLLLSDAIAMTWDEIERMGR